MGTYIPPNDLLKTCPYDSNHRVAPKRFSIHVARCAKKSTKKLKICPFNSSHRIEPELFDAHLMECRTSDFESLEKLKQEQAEWDAIPDEIGDPKAEIAELIKRVKSINVNGSSDDWDCSWDAKPRTYIIPGLEGPSEEVSSAQGEHVFNYQMMKPAQKKKLREKLLQETLQRKKENEMAPMVEAAAEKEQLEWEKLQKAKKDEQERFDTMRIERERIIKNREAIAKAKKEKKKAAKRAAFMAKQAENNESGENKENGPEIEDDTE